MGKTPIALGTPQGKNLKLIKLIDEGSSLNKEIKTLETRLESIKDSLSSTKEGCYLTPSGNQVSIVDSDKFSDPDPKEFKKALTEKRRGPVFVECVKVIIKEAKRWLSEDELSNLRKRVGTTRRYTFK